MELEVIAARAAGVAAGVAGAELESDESSWCSNARGANFDIVGDRGSVDRRSVEVVPSWSRASGNASIPLTRNVVMIGCSAGGADALTRILQKLPRDLPAAVCIVQHMAPTSPCYLVDILARASPLPVAWAEPGATLEIGRVVVGPPGVHLMLFDDRLQLSKGAPENFSRPSIDKLFRSAAATYGGRVLGVLLTGMLYDGVAGLCTIRDMGGTVIVQDPADAAFPELPSRALLALDPDRTLAIDAMGGAIGELVGEPVYDQTIPPSFEAEVDRKISVSPDEIRSPGSPPTLVCPECHGPMWWGGDLWGPRFLCDLGHATVVREHQDTTFDEVEAGLWRAVRALNDRATILEKLADDAKRIGDGERAETYARRARKVRHPVELACQFMGSMPLLIRFHPEALPKLLDAASYLRRTAATCRYSSSWSMTRTR